MIELTEDQLNQIVTNVFYRGLAWGHTYISWFRPTQENHDKRVKEAIKAVKARIRYWKRIQKPPKTPK